MLRDDGKGSKGNRSYDKGLLLDNVKIFEHKKKSIEMDRNILNIFSTNL